MTEMIAYPASISKINNQKPVRRSFSEVGSSIVIHQSSIINPPSAPSALLGDLPARHCPQDGGGCALAVQKSFLSLNRRIPNDWVDPRNLAFSQASPKATLPKRSHSEGRNVEMRHLPQFRCDFLKFQGCA
jgi:hypothetical protein